MIHWDSWKNLEIEDIENNEDLESEEDLENEDELNLMLITKLLISLHSLENHYLKSY